MEDWTSEYITMLNDIEARQEKLTEWEASFIDSIGKQMADNRPPSPKQCEILDRIWEKVT